MSLRTLAAVAGTLLVATASAHADPITDFMIGTTVYVRNGSITVDNLTHTTGGIAITKPANTLSFNIPASALGIPLPVIAHLTGTQLAGDMLELTFDEQYPGTGQLLVDDVHLTRATGTIFALVSYIPGATAPICNGAACLGDVYLDVLGPLSTVHVQGDFGDTYIAINYAQLIGGVRIPHLQSFYQAGNDPVCSKSTPTTVLLTARLAGPSPSPGTEVIMHSAFPAGVSIPVLQAVPAGHDSTTVTATIAAGFVGTVHLAAAAGGEFNFLDLQVNQEHDCDPPNHKKQWADYNTDLGCIQCSQLLVHDNENDRIVRVGRATEIVMANGTVISDLKTIVPGATAVTVSALAGNGMVAGVMTFGTASYGFHANLSGGIGAVQPLASFSPHAINQFGTVVGSQIVGSQSVAVYEAGHGITAIPIRGAVTSSATSINDNGAALGTYSDAAGVVRGFRFASGTAATVLPSIAIPGVPSAPILPIAENTSGQILGKATLATGAVVSAVISSAGVVTQLTAPSGYTNFVARGINRAGRVVGTATTTSGVARALVWNPTTGFFALTEYIRGMVATDALAITDGDDVVVSGTINGVTDLYLVSL